MPAEAEEGVAEVSIRSSYGNATEAEHTQTFDFSGNLPHEVHFSFRLAYRWSAEAESVELRLNAWSFVAYPVLTTGTFSVRVDGAGVVLRQLPGAKALISRARGAVSFEQYIAYRVPTDLFLAICAAPAVGLTFETTSQGALQVDDATAARFQAYCRGFLRAIPAAKAKPAAEPSAPVEQAVAHPPPAEPADVEPVREEPSPPARPPAAVEADAPRPEQPAAPAPEPPPMEAPAASAPAPELVTRHDRFKNLTITEPAESIDFTARLVGETHFILRLSHVAGPGERSVVLRTSVWSHDNYAQLNAGTLTVHADGGNTVLKPLPDHKINVVQEGDTPSFHEHVTYLFPDDLLRKLALAKHAGLLFENYRGTVEVDEETTERFHACCRGFYAAVVQPAESAEGMPAS